MWPFNRKTRKQKTSNALDEINELNNFLINQLISFRDSFEKFTYLGIEMTVISHSKKRSTPFGDVLEALLTCVYVDKSGVIHECYFTADALTHLQKENPA